MRNKMLNFSLLQTTSLVSLNVLYSQVHRDLTSFIVIHIYNPEHYIEEIVAIIQQSGNMATGHEPNEVMSSVLADEILLLPFLSLEQGV